MNIGNLQEALVLVQSLRQQLAARHGVHGFIGPTRILAGILALLVAATMASPWYPVTERAHVIGWSVLWLAAMLMNGFSLLYFFLHDQSVARNWRRLQPVLNVIPPLIVGAGFTFVFLLRQDYGPLFGLWMCMFGLANLAGRSIFPGALNLVGWFYVICGMSCLLAPGFAFTNPWPMGIVFCAGEIAGGIILYLDRRRLQSLHLPAPKTP